MVTQFVAAFDDIVINRYNRSRDVVDKINVRYLYAPKSRVLNDLTNKAQHIKIPAVSVSIGSVERDEQRVFNKIVGFYDAMPSIGTTDFLPSPVPVNIGINMSVITKYQTDMDQILSNFIPYSNPYIIISWKVPADLSNRTTEIRSEVEWSGSISIDYPTELDSQTTARVTADTSFVIKGWLFPYNASLSASNIFTVTTNFTPLTGFDYV